MEFKYNTVEEAIEAFKQGKMVLVTDDEDRENEGDLIVAAEKATPEIINFMATHAKGLICVPMSGELIDKAGLNQMVSHNTDNHETAFTVSVDAVDTTTGISAFERARTVEVLIDDNMVFDIDNLKGFLNDTSSFGFIAKENNKIIGFAYCYTLLRPDGKTMFYLHSIGMLPNYQDKGYGSKLLSFIKEYSKEIGCSEMFLITDKGNPRACHVYEKLGGKNDYKDEIVYVYDYEKGDK